MGRLWDVIDGEPYMINPGKAIRNPKLGVLLAGLNTPRPSFSKRKEEIGRAHV